jgi:hypothetical protein
MGENLKQWLEAYPHPWCRQRKNYGIFSSYPVHRHAQADYLIVRLSLNNERGWSRDARIYRRESGHGDQANEKKSFDRR